MHVLSESAKLAKTFSDDNLKHFVPFHEANERKVNATKFSISLFTTECRRMLGEIFNFRKGETKLRKWEARKSFSLQVKRPFAICQASTMPNDLGKTFLSSETSEFISQFYSFPFRFLTQFLSCVEHFFHSRSPSMGSQKVSSCSC